jgi:hypothetical protein
MLKRSRFFATAAIAATILLSGTFSRVTAPALAQSSCSSSGPPGTAVSLGRLESALKDMSSDDPAVINKNFALYDDVLKKWRDLARRNGENWATVAKGNATIQAYEDALEFWREKKARLELGDAVEVHSGQIYRAFLRTHIDELDKRVVGTWNWWNGYTVTFNANGGATYQGSSLVRSGVGRWQRTGQNSYHVHWLGGNTNDYFTLSPDGSKIEGTFDGKPGVSTRKC